MLVITTQGCAQVSGWGENDRGVSYTFGPDSVSEFLTKHDLDLVCRAHQARRLRCANPERLCVMGMCITCFA